MNFPSNLSATSPMRLPLGDSIFDRTHKISTSKTKRHILAYRLTNFDEN